jgi:hypothetical protein
MVNAEDVKVGKILPEHGFGKLLPEYGDSEKE